MAQLTIEEIISNPAAQATMVGPKTTLSPTGWALRGILSGSVSMGGASTFNSGELGEALAGFNSKIESVTAAINQITGLFNSSRQISSYQIKNIAGTMLSWQGMDNLSFTIPLIFVAYRLGQDVRAPIRSLMEAVTPTVKGNAQFLTVLSPPLGYKRGNALNPEGCVSVNIGNWLRIPPLMVVENVSFEFSREVIGSGAPLWAQAQVGVRAARIMSAEEISKLIV